MAWESDVNKVYQPDKVNKAGQPIIHSINTVIAQPWTSLLSEDLENAGWQVIWNGTTQLLWEDFENGLWGM